MKNFLIFFLLFLLLFSSCTRKIETDESSGFDGYTFHSKQYDNKQVLVSVVTFKTWAEFRAEIARQKITLTSNDSNVVAFSTIEVDNRQICTIYMIDPETQYLPEYTGHEFLHCVYGQFHIKNDSKGVE